MNIEQKPKEQSESFSETIKRPRYRVCFKSKKVKDYDGHYEWIGNKDVVKEIVEASNQNYPDVVHWVEEEDLKEDERKA